MEVIKANLYVAEINCIWNACVTIRSQFRLILLRAEELWHPRSWQGWATGKDKVSASLSRAWASHCRWKRLASVEERSSTNETLQKVSFSVFTYKMYCIAVICYLFDCVNETSVCCMNSTSFVAIVEVTFCTWLITEQIVASVVCFWTFRSRALSAGVRMEHTEETRHVQVVDDLSWWHREVEVGRQSSAKYFGASLSHDL